MMPEWAVGTISAADPNYKGTRIVGFRVNEGDESPSDWIFKLEDYLRTLSAMHVAATDLLRQIDHTLSVHGHIDADTPLHERVAQAVS